MDQNLLLLATVLIVAAFVVPVGLGRLSIIARAGIRLALFLALSELVLGLFGSPLRPQLQVEPPAFELWQQFVLAGWWAVTAHSAVLVARLIVILKDRPPEAQIVVDLLAAAIYVAAAITVITLVFSVPLGGLLATSGIIAIVLGLALQSTLSDVFSGIAVGLERPFRAGDLIWIDGGIEGSVLQVNWRSTHIATGPDHVTIIPNSIIAKSRVINHSRPTATRMDKVEILLDPAASTVRCIASLTAAARAARMPLDVPRPMVVQKSFEGDGAGYAIYFAVADSDALPSARTELYAQIQRHLRHDGISLAVRGQAQVTPTPVPGIGELLRQSDLFGLLSPDGRDSLSQRFSEVSFAAGERLMSERETPDALFVLASGTVEITRADQQPGVVHRMSPGGTLGAIGLVTGAPYAATATALTPVRAFRLDMTGISAAIESSSELSDELQIMAERGQAALASDALASDAQQRERPELFTSRMRHFLDKLSAPPLR